MLRYRKIYYALSGFLVIASIISLAVLGLNLGVDFKGGSIMELVSLGPPPSHETIRSLLSEFALGEVTVQDSGDANLILRFKNVDEAVHQSVLSKLKALSKFEEVRFESIGPVIGSETKQKSLWAVFLVVIMVLVYVAWAFRRISFPLRSWKYGVVAIIALFHDIVITMGVFALVGHFLNLEIGVPFVAALLTILGYSVNDTIIVFDRIRENVMRQGSVFDFAQVINDSFSQVYIRSLNTSISTLLVLVAIFLFGGATLKYFVLTLIIGISIGTYSSIFLASPLLFSWSMLRIRKR